MASKRNVPLKYEELMKIVDEMSDIEYISDENDEIDSEIGENLEGKCIFIAIIS